MSSATLVVLVFTNLNSYIIVGLMQKETVRSTKLRNFKIWIANLRKNPLEFNPTKF